ncbi:MAG: TIGR03986 family CRISPR-associated RAMP protein [Chitinophagales bacterium]|nr:TIGR03986 family CRISPR-associated RAMP protein [Chitinophagales bacterium]
MKKGKLIKEKNTWKITGDGIKNPMPVMGDFGLTDDMNGKEIEFDNNGGPVKLIRFEGKDYVKKQGQPQRSQQQHQTQYQGQRHNQQRQSSAVPDSRKNIQDPARAPYNFVPLNETVIPAQDIPDFDKYYDNRYTGYIDLNITTKTPLFIRGEMENFFVINEQPVIPGSSLRGMIRTLAEIVSYSKLGFSDDKRFSQRGMADRSSLKELYNKKVPVNHDDILHGYLFHKKNEDRYYIRPVKASRFEDHNYSEKKFTYEKVEKGWKVYTGMMNNKYHHYLFELPDVKVKPFLVDEEVIKAYINDETDAKKYEKGKNENQYYDVIEKLHREDKFKDDGIPVFYFAKGGTIISFGHTERYRIPYDYSVKDHLPLEHRKYTLDMAEAIFGFLKEKSQKPDDKSKDERKEFASRVFFEDANTEETEWKLPGSPYQPKILSSPKPTTFQHYLEQPFKTGTPLKQLKHWNDKEALIRGSKLYWHRKTPHDNQAPYSWVEKSGIKTKSHPGTIIPVKENVLFKSKIRFENLSTEELGCLLFVLELPKENEKEKYCHKLGMGKPLGLGSVQIEPTLVLSDRQERYKKIFDGNSKWFLSEQKDKSTNDFKIQFETYVLSKLTDKEKNNAKSLWEVPRLKQLKTMLQFKQDNVTGEAWLDRTRYMEIEVKPPSESPYYNGEQGTKLNEYKNRPVLPEPTDVVK